MGWDALRQWGDVVHRTEQFVDGVANEVWRVQLDGELVVARLGRRSDADLAWETDLMLHLGRNGLVVPQPVPTRDGRLFVDGLVVMSYVEGRPPETAADWQGVAATLRELHSLTYGWPQRPGWSSSIDLLHTTSGTKVDLTEMPDEAVERCRAAWARLSDKPQSVVHGDANNVGNVLITEQRVALVDWDEAHVDVCALDLVLPDNAASLDDEALDIASQASAAWEAAVCWDDPYSVSRLAEVRPC